MSTESFVSVEDLKTWGEIPPDDLEAAKQDQACQSGGESKIVFPVRQKLNEKIALWKGDVWRVRADGILNTTNERLNESNSVSDPILKYAGQELLSECQAIEVCHTGEAVVTQGYQLPVGYIVHTVGPRYSVKYQTAAENALHACYRRSLEAAIEKGIRTFALCVVNTDRKGYPKKEASHIALRTIRRFLEHKAEKFDRLVLCVPTASEYSIYEEVLPHYFPRNIDEAERAKAFLPEDIGNEWGEMIISDRKIKIGAGPSFLRRHEEEKEAKDMYQEQEAAPPVVHARRVDPALILVHDNPDDVKKERDQDKPKHVLKEEEINRNYDKYLMQARKEDLSDVARFNFLYQSGVDAMRRPVIVVIGNRIPADGVSLERMMMYIIQVLDPIVEKDYVMIYFHSGVRKQNKPNFTWMSQFFKIFNRKYKKNMKHLYMVHPTMWLRLFNVLMTPLVSRDFLKKVKRIDKIQSLWDHFDVQQLEIPGDIVEFDRVKNKLDVVAKAQPRHAVAENL